MIGNKRIILLPLLIALTIYLSSSAYAQEPDPSDPLSQPGGRWLYRSETAVPFEANGDRIMETFPSAYQFVAAAPADLAVLVYADNFIHTAPNTYLDQALQDLDISYTAHYDGDYAGFESNIGNQTWDIVIFANDNISPPTTTFDALDTYVQDGGRLIIHSWLVSNGHALWTSLNVTYVSNVLSPPAPIYWWEPTHPSINSPFPVPEFTNLSDPCACIYGQKVDWPAGTLAVGGYTQNSMIEEAALVIGNRNRTVFRAFLDIQNDADENSNGLPDSVELWQNLIQFAQPPLHYVAADSSTGNVFFLDQSLNRIRSFPAGASNPNGIATDGRLIWTGHFVSEEVVAYNFQGEERFRWSGTLSGLQGMEMVGGQLVINRSSAIDFYEPLTGNFIRSIPNISGGVEGIAYDGEYLWLLDDGLVAIDPLTGTVERSIPSAATMCSFGGTGLTTDEPGLLTLGCTDGAWYTVSTADGTILDSGNNGVSMSGLKIVPPLHVYLPMLIKDS